MGDYVDPEAIARNLVDRERGSVERNRAFRCNVERQVLRGLECESAALTIGLDIQNARDTVDVAGDDVSAKLVPGGQRPLQVDALPSLPAVNGRLRAGFVGRIDAEHAASAVGLDGRNGQAASVASD